MSDRDSFEPTPASRAKIPSISDGIAAYAEQFCDELMSAGLPPDQAASVVANVLLREAWVIAAVGRLSVGGVPDPDRFRARCEDAIANVKFKPPAPLDDAEDEVDA